MARLIVSLLSFAALLAAQPDEFLHSVYDNLHDSPMQRKMKALRPMPFGVVFLPWAGMTEQEMRGHFRLMKKLGFHNLKQTMPSAEWPAERILEIALEEGVIPFWYGEAGWEAVTPELLAKLGLPREMKIEEARQNSKMLAYQKEVLRRGIRSGSGRALAGEEEESRRFRHTPDPMFRDQDLPFFKEWLKGKYKSVEEVNRAWNLREVGISPEPFKTWEELEAWLPKMGQQDYGREYGRVLDVLRYKADYRTRSVLESTRAAHEANPNAPTRTGGEMGLFLPFAWRATKMEDLAETQKEYGSFYPSIHFSWHFAEVDYEVERPIYMQASFAADLFKGAWSGPWESTGGTQMLTGAKGWDRREGESTAGFTVTGGTMTQLFLSYLAAGFRGAGVWSWNYRRAGWEGGEYALLDRQLEPSSRAIEAGRIAQAAVKLRDELWQAHKEPYVGVLDQWDSAAVWAAISMRGRDHFRHYPMRARVGVSRALINGNVPWEHVTVDDLKAGLAPRYKTIYLPAQIALSEELLAMLTKYVEGGGRVVLDAPGGWYDTTGKVLFTGKGSAFEKLFGVEVDDFQYSNNMQRSLGGEKLEGFLLTLNPTRARVLEKFQTGEAAMTENSLGKGTAVVLAWDASFSVFKAGRGAMEKRIVQAALGGRSSPYACENAIVYRLAAPGADHYFLINDQDPRSVKLDTKSYRYKQATDAVTGERVALGAPVALPGWSGRWLRFEK